MDTNIMQEPITQPSVKRSSEYFPAICHMVNDTAQGSLPALLPLFISTYNLTYEQAAIIIFCNTAFASVAQPFFGYLADKRLFGKAFPLAS